MINRNDFSRIRKEMHAADAKREEVIQLSREIITLSKQIIYAAQRNDLKSADSAIYDVIHKNFNEAEKIKELVHDIYGEFLKLHLRNGELRKKSDSIKWNLKKLEEVMYDISMKGRH